MEQDVRNVEGFPERSLRDLYYVIFRHKGKVLACFLAVMVTVTLGTFLMSEIYRSEAKILLQVGRESVTLDPTAATGQIISVSQDRENEINSELEILNSRDLAEGVVDAVGPAAILKEPGDAANADAGASSQGVRRSVDILTALGLRKPLNERELAIETVMANLGFEVLKKSNIIALSYEARDPELAQAVLARLIMLYMDKHINVHRTPGSFEFFANQTNDLRGQLTQYEKELMDLKNQTGIASLQEQRRIILERMGSLKKNAEAAEAAAAASRAKVQAMKRELSGLPETIETSKTTGHANPGADGMRERLYELELKEQDLLSRYREDSIPVQEVRRQIAEARGLLDKEERTRTQVTRALNEAHQQVKLALLSEEATLNSLQAKAQALKDQLSAAQGELTAINYSEVRIAQLEREMDIEEKSYRKYTDNLEQARIDNALEMQKISNISVVQPATLPIKHVRPRKKLNLALGFFLGIMGGLGLAFVSEYVDHSLKRPEDVEERLKLPTLLAIAKLKAEKPSLLAGRTRKAVLALPPPVAYKAAKAALAPSQEAGAFQEEQWDRLVFSLNGFKDAPRVLAVTSCQGGEGVTTVASNLAQSLARHHADERVLLVDVDPRSEKGKQSGGRQESGSRKGEGSGGKVKVLHRRSEPNLDFLSTGKMVHYLPNLYDSRAFSDLLNSWRKAYAYVLFDVPPLNELASGVQLARLADGVILVVEAERVRWEVVQQARDRLEKVHANVLGVVLNKRRYPIPEWLYRTL
jgi:uncharacterized protein involved in exopolysaccharide biosynthesis/Mrp family chromosome partitioning ATPase